MDLPIFQVDAFTNTQFKGNPAAVVILEKNITAKLMQEIAFENNLSETAFVDISKTPFEIRWFTPTIEVDLCGHATLASAKVLFEYYPQIVDEVIEFNCLEHGALIAKKTNDKIFLDFPADIATPTNLSEEISKAIRAEVKECLVGETKLMVVVDNEKIVKGLKPNFSAVAKLDAMGLIVTAQSSTYDFVSRCFFPQTGVNEDPVTGSAHCVTAPYWAKKLNKKKLLAAQLSNRGGELTCIIENKRVLIGGSAVLYLKGKIFIG